MVPGGFSGGYTFLGNPLDDPSILPGTGSTYLWSTANATWGDFATEFGNGNTIAATQTVGVSMNPNGIYLPEETFGNLAGCPINGDWYITVRDNIGADDGYIFEWGLVFDPAINPNNETYTPQIVSSQWLTAATILPGLPTDTFIVVSSNTAGLLDYTFEVTDNFGCVYDTTVFINYVELPSVSINGSSSVCQGEYQVAGTTSFSGGIWTASGPGNTSFTPNSNNDNPLVNVDVNGTYTFIYTDNRCNKKDSIEVYFADSVFAMITGAEFCVGDEAIIDATSQVPEATYLWNTGSTSESITVTDSGSYYVEITGLCNSNSDTALVTTTICDITYPTALTPNGDGKNDVLFFRGLDHYPGSLLKVFNRWGNLLYESNDYQNNWEPTNLAKGTYFYLLNPGGVLESEIKNKTFTIF